MSYPLTILHCDGCAARFVLDPGALVEDVLLEVVRLLCGPCRDGATDAAEDFRP